MPERPCNAAILVRSGIFRGVDPETVAAIAAQLPTLNLPSGHTVFREGEPGNLLYIVIEGKVKVGGRTPQGQENLLAIMGPSDIFGEVSIFDPGPRTSTATTISEVHAMSMNRQTLQAWIAKRPEIAEQLLRVLARRLRRTNDNLADFSLSDVPGRVAKQLLLLAQQFGVQENGALRVAHGLTQEEIAQLVGASRVTVNKVLSGFVQRGWILLEGKTVLILDTERLNGRMRTVPTSQEESRAYPPVETSSAPAAAKRLSALHRRRMTYLRRPARA